jgi:Cephalosporin hydroxylase
MGSEIITHEFADGFEAGGIRFKVIKSDYFNHKTTGDEVVILKGPKFLRTYDDLFKAARSNSVLEFGVFEGGSILFFALAYPDFRFVGVDIRNPDSAVLDHIQRIGLSDRVTIYYNTSQSDSEALKKIMTDDFKFEALGLIIDDASHNYNLSKKTFELTFGHLDHNGTYCLEDWAWAHWAEPFQTKQWIDQPALTNLVFEILMLYPSTQGLIEDIKILPAAVHIRRGERRIDRISLDELIRARGKTLALI